MWHIGMFGIFIWYIGMYGIYVLMYTQMKTYIEWLENMVNHEHTCSKYIWYGTIHVEKIYISIYINRNS